MLRGGVGVGGGVGGGLEGCRRGRDLDGRGDVDSSG